MSMLEEAARGLTHDDLRTEILFGRPDEALINFAEANDIELIVVGARGHGASEARQAKDLAGLSSRGSRCSLRPTTLILTGGVYHLCSMVARVGIRAPHRSKVNFGNSS